MAPHLQLLCMLAANDTVVVVFFLQQTDLVWQMLLCLRMLWKLFSPHPAGRPWPKTEWFRDIRAHTSCVSGWGSLCGACHASELPMRSGWGRFSSLAITSLWPASPPVLFWFLHSTTGFSWETSLSKPYAQKFSSQDMVLGSPNKNIGCQKLSWRRTLKAILEQGTQLHHWR